MDERVQKLFDKVQAKRAEIEKAEKPTWETNCSFGFDDGSNRINLHTVTNVDNIRSAVSYLLSKKDYHDKTNKLLGLEGEFSWMGFSFDNWINDFKTRLVKIQINEKKKELDSFVKKLDTLVSPEMKREMEIAAIEKELED